MKKLFLLTSILFSLSLNAQNYHPFPDTTSIWHTVGMNGFSHTNYIFNFGIEGDTMINSKKYFKIFRDFGYDLIYLGALRENENKQILFKLLEDSSEFVLYDFNLTVGDSIFYPVGYVLSGNHWNNIPFKSYRVVTSIDSILLHNNEYRKRWKLSGNYGQFDEWVEGIGSINWLGLLNPLISDFSWGGDTYAFGCFKESDEIIYFDSTVCNYCMGSYILNVLNYTDSRKHFNVSYNPSEKTLSINSNREVENFSISIINSVGQTVYYNSTKSQNLNINLSKLIKGIYFYRISNNTNNLATGKFTTN